MQIDPALKRVQQAAQQRDWQSLRQACEAALVQRPHDAALWIQLSQAHSGLGTYRSARETALRALDRVGADARLALPLAARLRTFNEGLALRNLLQRFLPVSRMPLPLLLGFAAQLSDLNLHEEALTLLDEARRADPDYPPTLVSFAQVLIYLGRFEGAREVLQKCVRRAPELAQAWWLFAKVCRSDERPALIDALRARTALPQKPREAAMLYYALHEVLDASGEIEDAWQALEAGCRAMRTLQPIDPQASERLVDALVAQPINAVNAVGHIAGPTPIFIVGMHRSGTTLLEHLLSGHPQVAALGELYDFTSQMRLVTDHHCRGPIDETLVRRAEAVDWAAVGRGYVEGIAWRLKGHTHFTDKLPSNVFNVGWISQALPNAKLLHMVRDPMETCFSNLRELYGGVNAWSYEQTALAAHYRQYKRMVEHWHARLPGRVLDVDYARLTREPEAVLREVAAFCGLPFLASVLAPHQQVRAVGTASAVQVRGQVRAREIPKWVPYAEHLASLRVGLAR